MEEDELTELFLPVNNKFVKELLLFPQEKQLQIIKLGLATFTYSSQKFKTVIDGEKEDIVDKLTTTHQKEVDELKKLQSNLKHQIQQLKRENKQRKTYYKRKP